MENNRDTNVCSPVLQVLDWSKTAESAVDHNGHSAAESLTFFHTEPKEHHNHTSGTRLYIISNHNKDRARPLPVGGQNYSSSLFGDTEDAVPQEPFGFRVHTSSWLIL